MHTHTKLQKTHDALMALCSNHLTDEDIWYDYDCDTTEFRTACHEAGHTLMAWSKGCPIQYCNIIPDVKKYGELRYARGRWDLAAIVLAGPIGETIALRNSVDYDHAEIIEGMRAVCDDKGIDPDALEEFGDLDDLSNSFEAYCESIQRQFLYGNWAKYFKKLVVALLERKTLSGEDIAAIMGRACLIDFCVPEIPRRYYMTV